MTGICWTCGGEGVIVKTHYLRCRAVVPCPACRDRQLIREYKERERKERERKEAEEKTQPESA